MLLVRACNVFSLWDKNSIDEVPLLGISTWASKKDSNVSLFEIDKEKRTVLSDCVALRLIVSNFTAYGDGLTLIILDQEFVNKMDKRLEPDGVKIFGCEHYNATSVTYNDFLWLVKYTYDNKKSRIIKYESDDLKELVRSLSNEGFTKLLITCSSSKDKILYNAKTIANHYFSGEINKPSFLGSDFIFDDSTPIWKSKVEKQR